MNRPEGRRKYLTSICAGITYGRVSHKVEATFGSRYVLVLPLLYCEKRFQHFRTYIFNKSTIKHCTDCAGAVTAL